MAAGIQNSLLGAGGRKSKSEDLHVRAMFGVFARLCDCGDKAVYPADPGDWDRGERRKRRVAQGVFRREGDMAGSNKEDIQKERATVSRRRGEMGGKSPQRVIGGSEVFSTLCAWTWGIKLGLVSDGCRRSVVKATQIGQQRTC